MKAPPMSLVFTLSRSLRFASWLLSAGLLAACASKSVTENVPPPQYLDLNSKAAETEFDWRGIYKGLLPCFDCEGIILHVALLQDKTAIVHESRKHGSQMSPSTMIYNGPFSFGGLSPNLIKLASTPNAAPVYQFLVGENWIELRNRANGTPLSYDNTHQIPKIKAIQ